MLGFFAFSLVLCLGTTIDLSSAFKHYVHNQGFLDNSWRSCGLYVQVCVSMFSFLPPPLRCF